MNYSLLKSRTFWTLVASFAYNVWQLFAPSVNPDVSAVINAAFLMLGSYFHLSGIQTASQPQSEAPISPGV
jgi:hypothetical protein